MRKNMVKIEDNNKEIFRKMDPRKLEKIQIYPSKQHCGYNKMSNQLPKLTKTIMSPLTTMPPKKLMIAPHNGMAMKQNHSQQAQHANVTLKAESPINNSMVNNAMQISAMKNNFVAKNSATLMTSPKSPKTLAPVVQPTVASKIVENSRDTTAACYRLDQISLHDVHPYITCFLCRGYLIEATTIVECLHTYCHSCLMKHLAREKCCPQCDMSINKSKTNIKFDATIQSIVYKLVPGLYQKELLRRRAFYRQRPEEAKLASPEERGDDTEHLILSPLDLMSLSLDYAEKETLMGMESDENIQNLLKPKYLNCPAIFKVEHLKKFIVSKFLINSGEFNVEISYKVKTIVLPEHYTLMDVAYIYTWKKEAPMPFFFRIIAKNSKCDELPEVALRRSPTTTLPNVADETHTKKKSVSFKEEVESIEAKPEINSKASDSSNKTTQENLKKPSDYPPNAPRIETIKLKLDASNNNNVSIIKNTNDSLTPKFENKHKKKEKKNKQESPLPRYSIENKKSQLKESKKDEYEFDDGIEEQKLNFLNKFQLTAKKILNAKSDCTSSLTNNNKKEFSPKPTENNNFNKRKSKEPVKSIPKKYKFHEMKSVSQGNKFLFKKSGVGHEITFDMSPKPLGSKPSLSKVKSDIMQAQQRADAKVHKTASAETKAASAEQTQAEKLTNISQRNVPIKPKKLPMLLPKQPSPVVSVAPSVAPPAMSPTAFVIKKPETKKDFKSSEISVTKINEQNHHLRVYGPKPKSPVQKNSTIDSPTPQFKSPDGFAQPLPPKVKSNALPPPPTQILKPYGYPMKMPKNIPENMQTPYGCRTPFYVPSSPSYTPNFDPKPQFKYANPNAYASFMQTMFCAPNAGKVSPPINSMSASKTTTDNSRKRASSDNSPSVPLKRKSPSPSKNTETGSKAISILNQINFPSSLSVTLTNEQEENKKEQLRSQKQSVVNNNIEIIKISEEKESKPNSHQAKSSNTSPVDSKTSETRKSLPGLVPNPNNSILGPILSPPVAKALAESKESFQRAFLESLSSLAEKKAGIKASEKLISGRKKESSKPNTTETSTKDDKDKLVTEIKTEENANCDQTVSQVPKNLSKNSDALQASARKNISLTPPPLRSMNKSTVNSGKALSPPPFIQDPSVFSANAAQAMQFNLMLLNAAAKSSHLFSDYASMQQTMLLESLRQNVAIRQQIQQQQQVQKNPSSSHSPSSSASSPSSKH